MYEDVSETRITRNTFSMHQNTSHLSFSKENVFFFLSNNFVAIYMNEQMK